MKKKTIASIIVTTMILSLVGCSGSASSSANDASTEISSQEENIEEGPAEADIEEESEEESDEPSSEPVVDNSDLQDDQFRYDGKVFSVMDDVNAFAEIIDDSKTENYEEQTFYHTEDGLVSLETLEKDETELPIIIIITGGGVATNRNISVGSFRDDVIAAYGEPNVEPTKVYGPDNKELSREEVIERYGEELIYDLGDITITFIVTDGLVSSISYTNNANHDQFSWS